MSVAVAAKPVAAKPGKVAAKVAAKPVKLTGDELAKVTATIRERWNVADKGETDARTLFESAQLAWENARVIKTRVAYAAAMVTPNGNAANLLNACRILFADPEASAKERTKQAEAKKSTLRNYVDAGTALHEAGLAYSISEPTDEERKIVAAVFREGNKRDKQAAKDAKQGEQADKGEGEGEGEQDADSLTFADLVGHVAQMNKVLDMMTAGNVVISEREASSMADMLHSFQLKLSGYAADK